MTTPSLNEVAKTARVLAPGERIEEGDIFCNHYGEWCLTDCAGDEVDTIDYQYRRPSGSKSAEQAGITEDKIYAILKASDLPIFQTGGNAFRIAARRIYEEIAAQGMSR